MGETLAVEGALPNSSPGSTRSGSAATARTWTLITGISGRRVATAWTRRLTLNYARTVIEKLGLAGQASRTPSRCRYGPYQRRLRLRRTAS
jgi:hypothetical protein